MKIVKKEWLKGLDPCQDGFNYWLEVNKPHVFDFCKQCKEDNHLDWASWLIVRCMSRKQYITYAIYSAELVLDNFEKKYPDDKRPRKAIEAAKAVLKNNTKANRSAACSAYSAADSAAYSAADSAARSAYSAAYSAYSAARSAYSAAYSAARSARSAYSAARSARSIAQWKILEYGMKLMGAE